jgi:hypothetical protein
VSSHTLLPVSPPFMTDVSVPSDSLADVLQHLQAQRAAACARPLQCTSCILMIAPIHAAFNEDCALDNHCHARAGAAAEAEGDAAACMREFTACVAALRASAVKVWVFAPSDGVVTPDAHFPNNWISTHAGDAACSAAVDVHAMRWPSRRAERRCASRLNL